MVRCSRTNEALKLRAAGIKCPILILGMIPAGSMEEIICAGVGITIWHVDQIELADKVAAIVGEPARLHLKIDTGMSRLGANPLRVESVICQALKKKMVKLEGIFTHFARADEKKHRVTDMQVRKFCGLVERLERLAIRPSLVHCANSAAALSLPNIKFNLIRAGIAIYGFHPSQQFILPQCFKPALSWKSVISDIRPLKPGTGISYGHDYVTSKFERIGTIPVGYGDGFPFSI